MIEESGNEALQINEATYHHGLHRAEFDIVF